MRLPCCLEPFWGCCLFASCLFGESMSGATDFGDFLDFGCLFRFLPAIKATDFSGFPFFRCLFPLHKPRKASDFGDFLDFRCLFCFLPAIKATDFAGFPFFRCLLASSKMRRIPCRQARNGKCKKSNKNQKYYRQNQATPSFHFFARIVFEEPYCKKDCRYLPYYRAPKEEQRQARWHTTCK